MKEMAEFSGKLGSSGSFYEQPKETMFEAIQKDHEQDQQEQPLSLAELSRQYLLGEIDIEDYLASEQLLSPPFGESQTTGTDKEGK